MMERLMDEALAGGAKFADARAGEGVSSSIEIQDGRTEKAHTNRGRAIGVRVLVDGAWGFATTHELDEAGARKCLAEALEVARKAAPHVADPADVARAEAVKDRVAMTAARRPDQVAVSEKVAAITAIEKAAREFDSRIVNTRLNYGDGVSIMRIANTYGTYIEMETARTRAALTVVAAEGGSRQTGYQSVGCLKGFELIEGLSKASLVDIAAGRAVSLLSAKPAPSGRFPVIFDQSVTGLFVHEAFGHNSEADLVWNGESIIADRMGKKVASELVTIVDDSTLEGAWGSYAYDSEGVAARRRVLVEKGVVKSFLHSLETAARYGVESNGAGRCEGAGNRPIVRMSNTFIEPGASKIEDMIAEMDRGVLLKGALSGYVSTETGQFTCCAAEGWMIENGKIKHQVRDVSVNGMVLEALADVDAVSDSFSLSMPGTCGKSGQGVPVDNGGPHIRVKNLVVGGSGE